MLQASARLLRLLTLLQSRSTWAGGELAGRLEVTPRTLRRDIDRLRALGYPIEGTTGLAGGYALASGASLPPLALDQDEATAVFVGLHVAAGTQITAAGTAAMRALAKLQRVLPPRMRRDLRVLQGAVVGLDARSRPLSLAHVTTLAAACNERLAVRLSYGDRTGAFTERLVEPYRLVRVGALWYLLAWDGSKRDWRTFRLDRMRAVGATRERFAARPLPAGDVVAYVARSIATAPHPHRAALLLHAAYADVQPRVGAFDARFEPVSATTCRMEVGAPTLDVLVARILWLGLDFTLVDASDDLRRHLPRVARRLDRALAHRRASSRSSAASPVPPSVVTR